MDGRGGPALGARSEAREGAEVGSTVGAEAEHPGAVNDAMMTEAGDVIYNDEDYINLRGSHHAAAEVMDGTWTMVANPEVKDI